MEETKDLRRFIRLISEGRRIVALTMLAMMAFAGALGALTENVYPARATLIPAQSGNSSGLLNSLMGQVGGLASLVGFAPNANDSTNEAIALLESRHFIDDFIKDRGILSELAAQSWGSRIRRWLHLGARTPTMWDGFDYFRHDVLIVDQDKRTSIVTVEIDWTNRQEAADWANELVRRLNETMRERAISEANKSIEYLNVQLGKTTMVPLRDAIYKLIEANIKQRTIAHVREDYVFRVVDSAAVPDKKEKVKPHRAIYVIGGAISGLLLGVLIVLVRDFVRRSAEWLRAT